MQKPNWQLWAALAARLLQEVVPGGKLEDGVRLAFYILLIIWAYEEIVHGDSIFRRILGITVIISTFLTLLELIK